MKFYIIFLEAPESNPALDKQLIAFKKALYGHGNVTVIQTEQSNYDFLYNSLIEKANTEMKRK
jgi:hypothetical protein